MESGVLATGRRVPTCYWSCWDRCGDHCGDSSTSNQSREATTLGRAVAIAASTALVTNVCSSMVAVAAPDPDGDVVVIPAATVVTVAVVGSVLTVED